MHITNKASIRIKSVILTLAIALCLFALVRVALGSNIDPTDKFAWSSVAGWINFNPQCAGCEGVTVYRDHLEGYAWSETAGWIRMGTHTGGGAHTYANTAADNYGVNVDGAGNLSGYAWSSVAGWINFAPTNGGVTVDLGTGAFDGYAWSESVGWIHVKHTSAPVYGVTAVANVVLAKSVTPAAALPGDPITYTLTFSNPGIITATQVVLTDTMPVSVTNTAVISSGVMITQRAGSRYIWDIADLAPDAGGTITITGVLSNSLAAGTFTNTATITTTAVDADASNNTASVSITILLPPMLQSISPNRNSHTAPLTSTVSATYDVAMDASAVTSRTFVVHGRQSGLVTATHGLAADSRTLVVTPTRPFHQGELVHTIATTRTRSLAGAKPLTATQWQFRAVAGGGSRNFAPHLSQPSFGAGTSYKIALGDLDGDHDLDAFVAQYNLTTTVWLNAGHGTFTLHPASPNVGYATDVALGDIDGDGDLDAVVACYNQAQTVWLNDGAGAFTAHPTAPTFGSGSGPSRGIALGDLDNDGDLDAVVANQNGAAETVWLNDGAGAFTAHPTTSSFGAGDSQTVALGDIDGDGDLDALIANSNGQNETVWVNDGAGNFTPHPSVATFDGGPDSMHIALSDLDADGDLDAWIANFSTAPRANTVWLNDGTGAFSDSGQALGDSDSRHVALGDIDGDGDLDALVANTYGEANTVWKNDGAGNFTASSDTASFGASDSVGLAMGDIDGDSDLDVVVANDNSQAQTVWVQRNTLTLAGPTALAMGEAHTFTATVSPASAPPPITYTWDTGERVITHTSGVSDTAIISWTVAGAQVLTVTMTSTGDTTNVTQTLTIHDAPYTPLTAVDLTLLTGGAIYTNTVVEFSADLAPDNADKPYTYTIDYGDGSLATQATSNADPLPFTHTFAITGTHLVQFSAWNAGMSQPVTDTVSVTVTVPTIYPIPVLQSISPPRNAITAALNTNISAIYDQLISPTTVTSHTFAIHGMQSGLVMATHGLAADGHTLIVTPTQPFHQGELVYAVATTRTKSLAGPAPLVPTQWQFNAGQVTNRCVAGFTKVYDGSLPGVSEGASTWGDYDNDGDLDILLVGYGIGVRIAKVYENTGSGFSEDVVASGSLTGVSVGDAAWGDFDNDGDLDILITGWDGSNAVAKIYQNTDGGFDEVYAGDLTSVYHSDVAWGDYDNDGDLDILLTGNKVTHVYQNTGDGFVNVISNLTGISHGSVAWGDYDNDGDLDILLTGGASGAYVSKVYQNTGAGFSEVYAGSLAVVSDSSVAWGDYDNDGDLDILLSGDSDSGPIAKVYENTGGGFVEDTAASSSLSGVRDSHVAWGDYDNDGDLDLILSGRVNNTIDEGITKVYQNTGGGFSEVATGSLTGVFESSAVWGDYDNDGDLDILLTGYTSGTKIAQVYRNDDCVPSPPTSVTLTGPHAGFISQTYAFTATVSPITTTMPVTYVWRMADGKRRTIEHVGGVNDTVAISWTTAGTHVVTVTASNAVGAISTTYPITISAPPTYTLNVATVGQGAVSLNPAEGTYTKGTVVTLTAIPTTGWHFAGWSGDLNSANNPEALTMDGHKVVTATFSTAPPTTYTLLINVEGQGTTLPAAGSHSYISGTDVTVEATPETGWRFVGWSGSLSGTTHPITLTMDADKTVTATFTETLACIALTDVQIAGPTSGYTDTTYTIESNIVPTDATQPITLTWTPAPLSGQGTLTATYQWPTPGPYTVTLRAENCAPPDTVAVTATHAILISPPPATGDYEPNDACTQATLIATDGVPQVHTFHDEGDEDWIAFQATAGITYVIEARVPPTSSADVMLELYDTCTPGEPSFDDENPTFNPDIRFVFAAPTSGVYYLHLFNDMPTTYGPHTVYHLSVQALESIQPAGAVILVAGRYRDGDPLQQNIYNVTDALYDYALNQGGCQQGQVAYLSAEARPGSTGVASKVALQQAITQWAADRLGPGQSLTLYMFDHGRMDGFYLDGVSGELLSPLELDGWLDQLEAPGVAVNVIIEACHSGSFIEPPKSLSGPGRVVIASTSPLAVAYASKTGAAFSDAFINALKQTPSLWTAFDEGVWSARLGHPDQTPWLDDSGNGQANEAALDGRLAAQRAFACTVTAPQENWPPHITQATFEHLVGQQVQLRAVAQDDEQVAGMWSLIYPPSWQRTRSSDELIADPDPVILPRGQDSFGGEYVLQEMEIGLYRIAFHAQDSKNLVARPFQVKACIGDACVEPGIPQTFHIPVDTLSTTIDIPADAITATTTFTYTGFTDLSGLGNLTGLDDGLAFAGRGFALTAYQYGARQPNFAFQHPVTITVRYSDADVANLDETSLALHRLDDTTWRTTGLTVTQRMTAANRLVVQDLSGLGNLTGLATTFALFGPVAAPPHSIYLPLVLRK